MIHQQKYQLPLGERVDKFMTELADLLLPKYLVSDLNL
jgi:hypothetical protein